MVESRFIIGIDLGTTNSVLAYADLAEKTDLPKINILPVPQIMCSGVIETHPLLPSFLYLAAENELSGGSLALPWDKNRNYVLGEYARIRGQEAPGRLISSAKSWLCATDVYYARPGFRLFLLGEKAEISPAHSIDRRSSLLPWSTSEDVRKLSPVEVSTRILEYLRDAWDHTVAAGKKNIRLKQQRILLCVPASFDATARDLTMEAAKDAGFEDVTLLEEPQAAFYSWLENTGDQWRNQVKIGDLVLVIDIGGGTTDFSLIAVGEEKGELTLHRIAVGEHILLGGDNLDLALAHAVAARLAADDIKLNNWQLRALARGCCEAKEKLLDNPVGQNTGKNEYPLAILGRGAGVVGKSIKTRITRDEVTQIVLDGFFGLCQPTDQPEKSMQLGLQELGLAYAANPSISQQLARFLARKNLADSQDLPVKIAGEQFIHPTAILFNGGVLKSGRLCDRLVELLNAWLKAEGGQPLRVLPNTNPELAVARGAVYYGLKQRRKGVRIRGGIARSYYIGIESSMPAMPGHKPHVKALCVAPFGMEEGTEADVPDVEFGLVVGETAQFRFLSSTTRREDQIGTTLEDWDSSIEELAPIEAHLPVTTMWRVGQLARVTLHSKVTSVGTLELWCRERNGHGEWKLELNVHE
ncbi:MAG: Hsp70 family protein [Planctomycetota bacterium]